LHPRPGDFVVLVNKKILRDKQEIYENIDKLKPKKREHGNKPFRAIIKNTQQTYNVYSQIYLIRKHQDDPIDPWQVGYDYLSAEIKKYGRKMPDAMPWYLTTKRTSQ